MPRGFEESVEVKDSVDLGGIAERLDALLKKIDDLISVIKGDTQDDIEETIVTGGEDE